MTEHDPFLAEIRAKPDDDAARLVYADWLEEHGDPERAEFIRVQIEIEKLPAGSPRWTDLYRRETELLRAHRGRWDRPVEQRLWTALGPFQRLKARVLDLAGQWWYRRGFVEEVEWYDGDQFVQIAPELFAAAPIRNVISKMFGYSGLRKLLDLYCLDGLKSFHIAEMVGPLGDSATPSQLYPDSFGESMNGIILRVPGIREGWPGFCDDFNTDRSPYYAPETWAKLATLPGLARLLAQRAEATVVRFLRRNAGQELRPAVFRLMLGGEVARLLSAVKAWGGYHVKPRQSAHLDPFEMIVMLKRNGIDPDEHRRRLDLLRNSPFYLGDE